MSYNEINCIICDNKMTEFYTVFFKDIHGLKRHGSICKHCFKVEEESRNNKNKIDAG